MQSTPVGEWRTTYSIGLRCGLVAGLMGVAQWVIAQWMLAHELADFYAVQQRNPDFFDATAVYHYYTLFYFVTALLAAALALFFCLLSAYTVSRMTHSQRLGERTAWGAALVGGCIWGLATFVVSLVTPEPSMTDHVFTCESCVAVLAFSMLAALAPVAAWIGQLSAPGRYA
jgi:hypothetical protein